MRLIDFAARKIAPEDIKAAGYDGVIAYVSESRPGANLGAKPITREYADALRGAGLHIVSNFQYDKPGGSAPSDFTRGFDGGTQDAKTAIRLHQAAGGPDSAPIVFSVDDDIDLDTWNGVVVQWFRGINSILGVGRTGIYGHSRVCAWAIEDGVVGHSTTPGRSWVWQTRAWSSGQREPAAVLYQGIIDTASNPGPLVGGSRVDVNDVLAADFGQWELDRSVVLGPQFDESTEIRSPYHYSRGGTTVLWFALHTEDGKSGSARNLAKYLSNNSDQVSYHYAVDNEGHVYDVVDTDQTANSLFEPGNSKSINLAFASSVASWSRETWLGRMRRGIDIAAYIAVRDTRRYGLQTLVISPEDAARGITGITDHNGVRIATGVGTHTDVGRGFPWDYFRQKLAEYSSGAPAIHPEAAFPGAPIRHGATGRDVVLIQNRLNTVTDAGLLVDGEFGSLTGKAVTDFQRSHGLNADGAVDFQTWAGLFDSVQAMDGHPAHTHSQTTRDAGRYPIAGRSCSGQLYIPDESEQESATAGSEPYVTALQLQQLRGWATHEQMRDEVRAAEWGPLTPERLRAVRGIDPGPPVDRARKIRDVTGPGLTDRFSMAATDLGVMARTPSGRILAVFGDTFRRPEVGGPDNDWRAPVALFSDTKNLDDGIVWSEAAGGDRNYAHQLWPYDHHGAAGESTVLPSDVMTIGDAMYLHASAHFPFGNVGFTEIWKSTDDGHTWFRVGPRLDAGIHGGLAQLWTWDVGEDGWVYVLSTAFRRERDRPIILRRVRADRLTDPSAYEGWGFGPDGWDWRNEPTPVLEGGFGEMCLRRIQNRWVLVVFDNFGADLDVRVFSEMTDNLYAVPTNSPIHGAPWGQEGNGAVAQLYGPSIIPGSRLDGGFHILLSQWNTEVGWPYHVAQFKIPVPASSVFSGTAGDAVATHNGEAKRKGRPAKKATTSGAQPANRGTSSQATAKAPSYRRTPGRKGADRG
jgi:N-acetyl-anhydromuramyl-L-alanine amidase AmpD